ncbi:hypothetical protein Esi_0157_0020 [Ectocarpus siliculosus]|uniref:Uncharacterized protein n=1 Tax=Ectocarpus siliculosus TaxID=2880 RepID=D8LG35_ECTSI|nr:hypothetical protein Esi_0157_0020 [Ectocarpus siliculosus]|eukprot:CBN78934.1 hypothetical protein Esi_0157_0020 [Ectocarpus siliculosus]
MGVCAPAVHFEPVPRCACVSCGTPPPIVSLGGQGWTSTPRKVNTKGRRVPSA